MYSYNYPFLQIFIISFYINQLKSVHPFGPTAGVIRVKTWSRRYDPIRSFRNLDEKELRIEVYLNQLQNLRLYLLTIQPHERPWELKCFNSKLNKRKLITLLTLQRYWLSFCGFVSQGASCLNNTWVKSFRNRELYI